MRKFQKLVQLAVSNFSTNKGVILNLRSQTVRVPLSLCLSARRNKGKLVPDSCILWQGDEMVYQGKLNCKKLENILEKYDLCCFEVTNAEDMENGAGDFLCLGNHLECSCKTCKCRAEDYYTRLKMKYDILNDDEVTLPKSNMHDVIVTAYKKGWKEGKKKFRLKANALKQQLLDVTNNIRTRS